MKLCRALTLISFLFVAGCGEDNPIEPDPSGNEMSAKIDGRQWTADPSAITVFQPRMASPEDGLVFIEGGALTLKLGFIKEVGTYPLGVSWKTCSGGTGQVYDGLNIYFTPLDGAAGTVTITMRTDTRIAGTFAFTASRVPGTNVGDRTVTEGSFDVTNTEGIGLPIGTPSSLSATLDGTFWNAAEVYGDSNTGTDRPFTLQGSTTKFHLSLRPRVPITPGVTYGISQVDLIVLNVVTRDNWGAQNGDIGSVTFTTLSDSRVTGTFEATISPSPLLEDVPPIVITGGTFDVLLEP